MWHPSPVPGTPCPIVFVSAHTGLGGAEGYLDRLLQALPEDHRGPVVFLGDGPAADRLEARGLAVTRLPRRRRWRALADLPRLRRVLLGMNPGLVHAHGILAATATTLALAFTRIPIVWLKVDFAGDGRWANLIARRCRLVIGISRVVVSGFPPGMASRTRAVHCGLPDYRLDQAASRARVLELTGWPPDTEIVLVSGRLAPGKGQHELIEAAPQIAGARPAARFLLLGSEDPFHEGQEARLQARARELGVEDRLVVADVPHDGADPALEAVRVACGSDIVVVPSVREEPWGWREGFGLVGAESFAVGTPVVAYRNGSLPEVLGDCALMVDEGDREGLAAGVVEILSDPKRREAMTECGRRLVAERYRMEHAVAGMERCYAEVTVSGRDFS